MLSRGSNTPALSDFSQSQDVIFFERGSFVSGDTTCTFEGNGFEHHAGTRITLTVFKRTGPAYHMHTK